MADAAFWEGFAKELSGVMRGFGGEMRRRGEERREEERQIRREERGIEAYGKQLEMKEPYDVRAAGRIRQRQIDLEKERSALMQQRQMADREYTSKLAASYGDVGVMKLRETAAKGTNPLLTQAVMVMDKQIGRILAGERDPNTGKLVELDPVAVSGFNPLVQQLYNRTIYEHKMKDRTLSMQEQRLENEALRLQESLAQHELLQQQREDVGLTREINRLQDLEAPIAKAQKGFLDIKRELMNSLAEQKIINKKGEVTKGGKNLQLYNPETKEFNADAKARLLQYYPQYQMWFESLDAVKNQLVVYEDMKEKFKATEGEAKTWTGSDGKTYEVGKTYTLGGQKVKCIGENQFEPVK